MAKQSFSVGQVLTAAQMNSLQQTAMLGGSATAKTASYTLVAADAGTVVSVNSTSATTITVNTALFSAGDTVTIQNWGSGAVTITAGTATVNTAGSLIVPQYDGGVLYFTSASAAIYFDFVQAGAVSPLTTKGDLYTFGSSDTRLAVGTNGHTLVANSATATGLEWAAPASGAFTQLATASFSGTTIDLTSISGSYKNLVLVFQGITSTSGADIQFRFNNNSNNDYAWTQYWTGQGSFNTGNPVAMHQATQPAISGTSNVSVYLVLPNYANTSGEKQVISWVNGTVNGTLNSCYTFGTFKSTSAINRITTVNIVTGGSYFLYGEN